MEHPRHALHGPPDGRQVRASVKGDRDPGYGSTSKMISESGVCLVSDCADVPGGIWTPGAAMGDRLIKRDGQIIVSKHA